MIALYHAHYEHEAISKRRRIDVDPLRILAAEERNETTDIRVEGLSESIVVWHAASATHDTIVADIAKAQAEARSPVVTVHGSTPEKVSASIDRAARTSDFTALK